MTQVQPKVEDKSEEAGKIFVGGLSWETTQEKLLEYFSRFGEVVDCVVMKNNETGKSRGFGFVTFKDIACVAKVLSSGPHELDGRTIDPKVCSSRDTQQTKKAGQYPKVFLGGLPPNCTETDLRSFFSRYGTVIEVVLMYDQEKKKSRGFGFLSFETEDSVKQVCAEHFVKINGKKIECKHAEPRDKKRPQGQPNAPANQWGGPPMGPPGWGPGAPAPGAPGPAMGPGGPMPGPMPGPGPMGPPMNNGMMGPPGGYQGGWGGPPPYGPQGGWGPQPGAYGPGYNAWGCGPGYGGPYNGPPGPQYGQPGYGGYGYGANYGPYGGPMAGPPPPNPPAPGTENFSGAPMTGTAPAGPAANNTPNPAAPAGPTPPGMGSYPQEASNFGPQRAGFNQGYGAGPNNYNAAGNYNAAPNNFGAQGADAQANRNVGQTQGYHPYRR